MKKILIGIFFLGLTNLIYSQTAFHPESFFSKIKTLSTVNAAYINNVFDANNSKRVVYLENKVAEYDIKKQPLFNKEFESYIVVFEEHNNYQGSINATYDENGEIINTHEKFKNIKLPFLVLNVINKTYPGFIIQSNFYIVNYSKNKATKKFFKVKIEKEGEIKSLKINPEGKII
ncbi:hypothetical protein SAMN05428642_10426 [Flaviramulus basaltis]|uniref:Uncharacterized protein n=1 Tax=Flaviramulus basaltis TaxID=369401 RepID=A0A1K2IRA6_9FLAO|nr:hypothetical protein [Flaviramulus basaltis]SFZ94251.1 hypothetical protein SAMN05428642_10426 [Flaviramulus basaltis]